MDDLGQILKPNSLKQMVDSSAENHYTNEFLRLTKQYSNCESSISNMKVFLKRTSDNSLSGLQSGNNLRCTDSAFVADKCNQNFFREYFTSSNVQEERQQFKLDRKIEKQKRTLKQKLNRQIKEYSKLMDRAFHFLEKFFSLQEVNSKDFSFGELELHFIKNLLSKKSKMDFNLDFQLEDMIKKMQIFNQSQKRFEENFKMILKLANDFFIKELGTSNKQGIDNEFYLSHYFGEVSIVQNINLEEFKDPSLKTKKKGVQYIYNSLNNEYLKLLMKSQKYSERLLQFIKEELVEIYLKNIHKKFQSMKKFLKKKLREKFIQDNYNFSSQCFREVIENYFNCNKQCKIPWSIHEVRYAQQQILERINKLT